MIDLAMPQLCGPWVGSVAARAPCGANLTPFRPALAILAFLSGCIQLEMAVLPNFSLESALFYVACS